MQSASSTSVQKAPAVAAGGDDEPDLSVVIVNYNVREFLEQALQSVERAAAGMKAEIFVVDNNSVDGSVNMVRERFPDVKLIVNPTNVGFSRANNQAIRQAHGNCILLLNPDTIVQEDTFHTLLRFMEEHPDAGAVGCKILNPDGSFAPESRRAFPRPAVALYRLAGLSRLFPRSRIFGRYNMSYLSPDQEAEVDALSGSCMLVRRAAIYDDDGNAARLLDEDFFMYGEDLDWCYRIQQAGWKIFYTPETQIIHYKGESTKRGELRYVRLFYGAMLHFSEKHFGSRYSNVFAILLRLGIFTRAAVTLVASAGRRLASPLVDALLVYLVVSLLGAVHSIQLGAHPAPLLFLAVAPAYALATAAGVALAGGYRRQRRRLRPVWNGALLGLLFVAAASFFVKDIAFSRAVVLLSFPLSALVLAVRRLLARRQDDRRGLPRQALLVGPGVEGRRLRRMVAAHPHPPFILIGYVAGPYADDVEEQNGLPCLGGLNHLRDLVRLRRIDDVIFAADGLTNRTIFSLIQQLRDLPVQFKILGEGRARVIGKASVDDLSIAPLIEVEDALGDPRSMGARRAFEIPLSLAGLLLHPLLVLLARGSGGRVRFARIADRTRRMPAVLIGRQALVGYHTEDAFVPPPEWGLRPGVFAITDTLRATGSDVDEISRAYWFYVRNQSAALDWDIIMRSLSLGADSGPDKRHA